MKKIFSLGLVLGLLLQPATANQITTQAEWTEMLTAEADSYGYNTVYDWIEDLNTTTKFREHASSDYTKLVYNQVPFTDVINHNDFDVIDIMYNKGLLSAKEGNLFCPDEAISFGEFAEILMKSEKIKFADKSNISSVSDGNKYMPYICGAKAEGILPDFMENAVAGNITRIEAAAMLSLAYEYKTKDTHIAEPANFSDYASIPENLKIYADKIYELMIFDEGNLNPNTYLTRAQAAKAVNKLSVKIDEYLRSYVSIKEINFRMIEVSQAATQNAVWDLPPKIIRATEDVLPGDSVQLYGEGFTDDTVIKIAEITEGDVPQSPISSAIICPVTLVDNENSFITFTMPSDVDGGAYYVWAQNQYGTSETFGINTARLQWISEKQGAEGCIVKVMGRNLDGGKFGSETKTKVALYDGTNAYECIISRLTPFAIDFIIPYDIPSGLYDVYATNDGIIWTTTEDDRQLEIVDEICDPIGLGVAWANKFTWDRIYNVMDYGARCNGTYDDSRAINTALIAASIAGGGLVYLPDNTYYLKNPISMPDKTVLAGESREGTIINYTKISNLGSKIVISNKDLSNPKGINGVFRMTFLGDIYSQGTPNEPDILMYFGNGWSDSTTKDKRVRTADYYFVKDVNFKQPWQAGTGRGLGIVTVMRDHFLLEGCNFSGLNNTYTDTRNGDYIKMCDCDFVNPYGPLGINGCYCVYENNRKENINRALSVKFLPFVRGRQGFFIKGPAHIENNVIIGTGTQGGADDGETICCENFLTGISMGGYVRKVEGNDVYITPFTKDGGTIWGGNNSTAYGYNGEKWDLGNNVCGETTIIITEGRGIGQMRKISAFNEVKQRCTISEPWDIAPDNTSKFIIGVIGATWFTVYNNKTYDGGKGIWIYRGSYDTAVVGNYSDGTTGVTMKSALTNYEGDESHDLSFHSRIDDNVTVGGACYPQQGALIGFDTLLHSGLSCGYLTYGGSLRRNEMRNNLFNPDLFGSSDCVANGTIGIGLYYQISTSNSVSNKVIKGIVFENNKMKNTINSYRLGDGGANPGVNKVSGILMQNNIAENVLGTHSIVGVTDSLIIKQTDNGILPYISENFNN